MDRAHDAPIAVLLGGGLPSSSLWLGDRGLSWRSRLAGRDPVDLGWQLDFQAAQQPDHGGPELSGLLHVNTTALVLQLVLARQKHFLRQPLLATVEFRARFAGAVGDHREQRTFKRLLYAAFRFSSATSRSMPSSRQTDCTT